MSMHHPEMHHSTIQLGAQTEQPRPHGAFVRQPRGFDLLRIPGLRRFLRWRYARLTFQLPLLALALFALVDGFTGRQLAPDNVATTTVWVHYRGFVVLALALAGNAFCAACPLMLMRGPSKFLARALPAKLKWPKMLRNKYLVVALMLAFFFSYEVFGLWASPWLSAWLIVGYFGSALAIDTLFSAGTFCKYVCPLGNFNFLYSSASPTQIAAANPDVCRNCKEKPCLHGRDSYASMPARETESAFIPLSEITHANGKGHFPGCESNLLVPTMQSNMDCTFCFNCVRACPYDNVALKVRPPGWEWFHAPWLKRWRLPLMLLGVMMTFLALLNAFGMIGPSAQIAEALADWLGSRSEALIFSIFLLGFVLLGLALVMAVSCLADLLGGAKVRPWKAFQRWGYVSLALGFGFWCAHYLFHFMTGAGTIVPVFQHFFAYRGADITPNWQLSQIIPGSWLFPMEAGFISLYSLIACYLSVRIGLRDFGRRGVLAMWPMLIYIIIFMAIAIYIMGEPMQMRGTIFAGSS
jgi:polyferredoxin